MLDLKELRKDPQGIETKLRNKVPDVSLKLIIALDEKLRALKTEVEELKSKKNHASKEIGARKQKGEAVDMSEMASLGEKISLCDQEVARVERELQDAAAVLPNVPMDDVPVSPSPKDNVCNKEWGKRPEFHFPFKNHVELNEKLS